MTPRKGSKKCNILHMAKTNFGGVIGVNIDTGGGGGVGGPGAKIAHFLLTQTPPILTDCAPWRIFPIYFPIILLNFEV